MRKPALVLLTAAALASLAACATGGERPTSSESPMDRLQRQCEARGGLLTPSGANSGVPALDNLCNIHGTSIRAPEPERD